jgi:hypothetical protein
MKTTLILVFFTLTTLSFGQRLDKFETFVNSDYPREKFQVTIDTFRFFNMIIESKMARNISGYDPFSCRAWLTVNKNNKPIFQRFFKSINALGGCFGLFIPFVQPRRDFFILSKLGDYDSRIFIIDSVGEITEKFGGEIYVSKDKRYLFAHSNPDGPRLTVYDFAIGQCLFSDIVQPDLDSWYFQDNKYLSTVSHYRPENSSQKYVIFDLTTNKLVISTKNDIIPNSINRLVNYSDLKIDCNCGLERTLNKK